MAIEPMGWAAASPILGTVLSRQAIVRSVPINAVGGAGDTDGDGGDGLGGGIYNDGSTDFGVSSLTITGSTITHNDADGGAGGASGSAGQGIGGGLYLADGGIVCIDTATVIKKNHASTSSDDTFGVYTTC